MGSGRTPGCRCWRMGSGEGAGFSWGLWPRQEGQLGESWEDSGCEAKAVGC